MSIHVILGKPGSGKTLYAVSRVIEELANGDRNIVTNLPIRLPELNEYIQRKYPNRDCRVVQRVRLLTDEQLREFWKYRQVEDVPTEKQINGHHRSASLLVEEVQRVDVYTGGVAYFLDEAHIAFNARDWANLGRGALHYLSQHRKLGDIVWVITQAPGNLDKQFRSVAEDFTVLRNEYLAKYGPFKGRGRFVRRTYLSESAINSGDAFEKAAFALDKEGVASCYDTAKGIGVHGSKADIGRKVKGISIWWAVVGAFVLAALVGLVPWAMGKVAQKAITGGAKHERQDKGFVDGAIDSVRSSLPQSAPTSLAVTSQVPPIEGLPPLGSAEFPLYATGYVMKRGVVQYQLSDGRVVSSRDPEMSEVSPRWFKWEGKRVWVVPRPPLPKVEAPPLVEVTQRNTGQTQVEETANQEEEKPAPSRPGVSTYKVPRFGQRE